MTIKYNLIYCLSVTYLYLFISYSVFAQALVWRTTKNQLYRIDILKKTLDREIQTGKWTTVSKIHLKNIDSKDFPLVISVSCFSLGHTNSYYLVIDCSQQVYKFDFTENTLERIDKTYFRGFNCMASRFYRNDTLYSFGGYGFWHTNNILTYYKSSIGEWESLNSKNNSPESIFRGLNGFIKNQDIFFSALNFNQNDSKNIGKMTYDYNVYNFSFKNKEWSHKGVITQDVQNHLGTNLEESTTYWNGKYFLIKYYQTPVTRIFIINPISNLFYVWEDKGKLFPIDPEINPFKSYVWGDTLYYYKITKTINGQIIQKKNLSIEGIKREADLIGSFFKAANDNFYLYIFLTFMLVVVSLAFYLLKVQPKVSVSICNNDKSNFDISYFSEQELLVWKTLITANDGLSTEKLNSLLGIDNKMPENQRRIRYEIIKSINSKIKTAHSIEEAIQRIPTKIDKRMYNYVINKNII